MSMILYAFAARESVSKRVFGDVIGEMSSTMVDHACLCTWRMTLAPQSFLFGR